MNRDLFAPVHDDFRASVRAFVDGLLVPRRDEFAANGSLPRDVWRAAAELGLLGLEIPGRFGGTDERDYRFNVAAIEELARVSHAFSSAFTIDFDVVASYLTSFGTEAQQERWSPGLASGQLIGALAMTEPGGGSDVAALTTTASRDGDSLVINGAKTFITNGTVADIVIVAARTGEAPGAKGLSLVVVEATDAGFTRGPALDTLGLPESDAGTLFFDQARVPADRVLGEPGRGFAQLMARLPQERLGSAVANVAQARAVFDFTLPFVKERIAFGGPIGSLQANRFTLAELATQLDVAQAYVDACIRANVAHTLTAADAAKAKWFSADVENAVIDHCLQLHGGAGWLQSSPVGRAWIDARVTKIWAGSNEVMKEIIGKDLGL